VIVDEHVYLDHAGVKGMKWGVRQAKPSPPTGRPAARAAPKPKVNRQALLRERERQIAAEKSARRRRNATRALLAGGALVAGAIVVNRMMARNKAIKMSQIKDAERVRDFQKNLARSQFLFNSRASTPMSQVRRGFAVNARGVATPIISSRNPFQNPVGLVGTLR
jgi:hypothetical protein